MTAPYTLPNLDQLAAKHAQATIRRVVDEEETQKSKPVDKRKSKQQLANEIDNTVTKALGVLQENGVYACFLYLLAKEKENGEIVVEEMLKLLEDLKFGGDSPEKNNKIDTSPDVVLDHVSKKVTAGSLERLLLAKETLEQMLIYARYGAKARSASQS